jgi:hypothetical protein
MCLPVFLVTYSASFGRVQFENESRERSGTLPDYLDEELLVLWQVALLPGRTQPLTVPKSFYASFSETSNGAKDRILAQLEQLSEFTR